ncbi:putative RNA-directed DNA polymerase [Helianthus annuus]|nr:putative RNA-directed DNA polymerase [Helianthus annuus]
MPRVNSRHVSIHYWTQNFEVLHVISPCVFIKRSLSKFTIIAVYVDDINIIGAPEEIEKTANILKKEFKMKDLGTTKLCLGLQFEHLRNGTFIHQSNYIQKMLVRFNMDKAHPLAYPWLSDR